MRTISLAGLALALSVLLGTVGPEATEPGTATGGKVAGGSNGAGPVTVERQVGLMGTRLELRVDALDRGAALRASERALEALEATESRLSTWRPDTELARLNRAAPGEPVPLSTELATELETAAACWRETSGAFDPAMGALATAWGLRTGGREPTSEERREALAATGMDGLELRRSRPDAPWRAVRRREGLVLDEGGFGKGAGLRAALTSLAGSDATAAALDLGGQWAFWRQGPGQEKWRVAVAHPRERRRAVAVLTLDGGSVATSGHSERAGHLLDPRQGLPAADFGSLTVWTPDPLWADCLSTGLYVLGPDAALAWAQRHGEDLGGVEVLVLRVEGRDAETGGKRLTAQMTRGLAHRFESLMEGLTVEVWAAKTDLATKTRGTTAFKLPAIQPSPRKSRAVRNRATPQEEYTWSF